MKKSHIIARLFFKSQIVLNIQCFEEDILECIHLREPIYIPCLHTQQLLWNPSNVITRKWMAHVINCGLIKFCSIQIDFTKVSVTRTIYCSTLITLNSNSCRQYTVVQKILHYFERLYRSGTIWCGNVYVYCNVNFVCWLPVDWPFRYMDLGTKHTKIPLILPGFDRLVARVSCSLSSGV